MGVETAERKRRGQKTVIPCYILQGKKHHGVSRKKSELYAVIPLIGWEEFEIVKRGKWTKLFLELVFGQAGWQSSKDHLQWAYLDYHY